MLAKARIVPVETNPNTKCYEEETLQQKISKFIIHPKLQLVPRKTKTKWCKLRLQGEMGCSKLSLGLIIEANIWAKYAYIWLIHLGHRFT